MMQKLLAKLGRRTPPVDLARSLEPAQWTPPRDPAGSPEPTPPPPSPDLAGSPEPTPPAPSPDLAASPERTPPAPSRGLAGSPERTPPAPPRDLASPSESPRRTPPRDLPSAPECNRQETVFIIDDHPDRLRDMCLALAGEAYGIESAGSVEAAIEKLSSLRPALILLDSQMLEANGSRLTRRLLADEELAAVPVVALRESGGGAGKDKLDGRFDGHIVKPVEAGALAGQVRGFLAAARIAASHPPVGVGFPDSSSPDSRRQAAEWLEAIQAGLPDSQFAPATRNGLNRLADVVEGLQSSDLAAYLQQAERLSSAATQRARGRFLSILRLCRELVDCDDLAPAIGQLRAGYLSHRRAELSHLEKALRTGDWDTLRKAGHNLKGTGAAYGFTELTEIGRALESAAKEHDQGAMEALLDRIAAYISIVQPLPERQEDHVAGN